MLGWWVDETKGYHLEDLENGKLIASQDVQFSEDDSPSELAVVEVGDLPATNENINNLVDDAIIKDAISPLAPDNNTSPAKSLSPLDTSLSDFSKEDTPTIDTASNNPVDTSLLLVLRQSGREQKVPSHFAFITSEDITTHGNINIAFIAVAKEPKTYQEAIQSLHLKQ